MCVNEIEVPGVEAWRIDNGSSHSEKWARLNDQFKLEEPCNFSSSSAISGESAPQSLTNGDFLDKPCSYVWIWALDRRDPAAAGKRHPVDNAVDLASFDGRKITMRKLSYGAVSTAIASLVLLSPSAAWAGTDIDWFYNSGDHDAKARFRSVGEYIDLCKLNDAKVYVEYGVAGGSINRTYYDGGIDTCKEINWSATEGRSVQLKVCEQKTWAPDDCSGWRYGTA